jgi:TrmH family RNA methyltransferase
MPETLVSEKNPLLKQIRRAVRRGSLTQDGFAVSEGPHLLEDALAAGCEIEAVLVAESARSAVNGVRQARVVSVRDDVFSGVASTETTQGVIALVRPPVWTLDDLLRGQPLIVILDGVQDPGNAGAILRAAEAFGATGVVFLRGTVSPYNPKCLRASAGSIYRLPFVADFGEMETLEQKAVLYAAMADAKKPISEVDLSRPCAIIIGSEGRGVSPNLQTRATAIRIPTAGVESLNAAVAAGVLLYEARRQRAAT